MKPSLLILSVLLTDIAFAQIGAKTQQNKIHGIWQNNDFGFQMTLILNADGSGEFDGAAIRYTVQSDKLVITQEGVTNDYTYALQQNALTLTGGDLDAAITFKRSGDGQENTQGNQPSQSVPAVTQSSASSIPPSLIGVWSANGEMLEFRKDGQVIYQGQSYPYQVSNGHIIAQTSQGTYMYQYAINGDELSFTANGQTVKYKRGTAGAVKSVAKPGEAKVAQELVGKWCYIKVSNSGTGGSMSNECYTLKADGTYEYYYESSRSVNTSDMYAGTATQDGDRGTWSYDGVNLYYNSNTKGSGSYTLEKRNHPKTGDPMIVLNGYTYVTYFNKTPW